MMAISLAKKSAWKAECLSKKAGLAVRIQSNRIAAGEKRMEET